MLCFLFGLVCYATGCIGDVCWKAPSLFFFWIIYMTIFVGWCCKHWATTVFAPCVCRDGELETLVSSLDWSSAFIQYRRHHSQNEVYHYLTPIGLTFADSWSLKWSVMETFVCLCMCVCSHACVFTCSHHLRTNHENEFIQESGNRTAVIIFIVHNSILGGSPWCL